MAKTPKFRTARINEDQTDVAGRLKADDWSVSQPTAHVAADSAVEGPVHSASPRHSLAGGSFMQDWANNALITTNDDWSGVPSIVGYLGDDASTTTADRDPRLITAAGSIGVVDVIANLNVTTSNAGGVGEFQIANPTIGLQGSGTADAPGIVIYLDSTGRQNVRLTCNIRDIDSTVVASVEENAVQQLNIQYRTDGGTWINVPGGYFADVTALGATMVTAVDLILPAGANNAAALEIRIFTVNAGGSDEWVGIDDIVVSSVAAGSETQTVQFDPVSVTQAEGQSGTTTYTFTVTRTGGTTGQLDFSGTFAPGTTDAADYVGGVAPTVFSGSILAGATSATITIAVQGDTTPETNETFSLTITNATNGAAGVITAIGANDDATGTITNDDVAPTPGQLSIGDVTLAEGNSGTTAFTFTVLRSSGSNGAVSATWTLAAPGGANLADSADFANGQPISGTVSFADGQTSQTITILVQGDVSVETNETFLVTLSAPTGGATLGNANGTGTITNDDVVAQPAGSIGDVSIVEGNAGVSYLIFTVTLSSPPTGPASFAFATSNGTATAGSDYLALSGEIYFTAGQTSQTISVPIVGDVNPEASETLIVTLSNPLGGVTISDGTATGTITNDDVAGYYSLAGGSFTQNWTNIGQITANDDWSGVPFVIGYRGDDLTTATGTDARTITGTSSVVDVNANQTNPDTFVTGGVTEFHLANPVVGLTGSGTADAPYLALYMDATGRSNVRVQANLRDIDGSADDAVQQIAVQYRTSPSGPWLNAPGGYFADVTTAGSATQVTAVDITLPADANGAATLEIRFLTTNAAGNDEYVGIDDIVISSALAGPTLSITDAAVFEGNSPNGNSIVFTVTRSGDTTGAVTADYSINLGTAPYGATLDDFGFAILTDPAGQVSFAAGQTSATISISLQNDGRPELDETFTVTLSNPTGGAVIADGVATGTIVNDDGPPTLVTINDVTVTEGDAGTSLMTFTVTRTGNPRAFSLQYTTADGTAHAGSDYVATSGTLVFQDGQMSQTVSVTINGDTQSEVSETLQLLLSNANNNAIIIDGIGIGTIAGDDPLFIHDIQGTSYFSPILASEGISTFNTASAGAVTVRAVVTAVDNVGPRQGYYLSEEITDWDGNSYTSEGIFVMTRNDAGTGTVVSGVSVGDLVQLSANVMEYQSFNTMPRTVLVNPTGLQIISTGNALPTVTLTNMPNAVMTLVTPDYTDSSDGAGDSFDASLYALSYFETVEGMLVTIPNMVVADGFVSTSGGRPFLQAYSLDSANAGQVNSRGGYTISGDPPIGPPDTAGTGDDTHNGGRVLHDGDINPDVIELDFTDFATAPPTGLLQNATMGDLLGDVTGIIDFDFTDRKLFVTGMEPGGFVDGGNPVQETTLLGDDSRALTVATFNVENLDPTDGAARFTALANAIANNLNAPDIISIEEMQDNNGAAAGDGIDDDPNTPGMQDTTGTDASQTWQMLVDALNLATGAHYQWVDQAPVYNAEGGEQSGNIRVGFLYNTDRVQLGNLDANATLAERRMYTDRIGDGVRDGGDLIAYSDNMIAGEINTADWTTTRKSLLGEFTFHGNTVYVAANHWPSKGGSGEFWQYNQNLETGQPSNSDWAQRSQVGQDVYTMLDLIQSGNPNAGIVAGGDFNDFYFYRPLTTVTGYTMADGIARVGGARFDNLTLTLTEGERYTYTFDGRSQAIDHIIANQLLSGVATYDVVHLNTGYNENGTGPNASPALSDHDPGVSSYDYRNFSEVLAGTAGNDMILGFGGNDTISGLDGADYLDGGIGADTMAGGAGDDTYVVDESGDQVIEGPGAGNDRIITSISYTLGGNVFVETLEAVAGVSAINLTGNYLANTLIGNNGANQLHGGGGADTLTGLGGDDIYYTDVAAVQVVEASGGGFDQLYTSVSYQLAVGSEVELLSTNNTAGTGAINLTGNASNQTIVGNNGANQLHGGGGTDTLIGYGGNDIYYTDVAATQVVDGAGEGFDQLYTSVSYVLGSGEIELLSTNSAVATAAINLTGNQFGQLVLGNAGANVLDGKGGADTLVGYGGADTFAFTSALGGGNVDVIADFQSGVDKIALDDAVFTALGLGALSANAFVIGSAALDADDRIIYNTSNGGLYYDADGAGGQAAVLFAYLSGVPAITASDFTVI